MKTRWKRDTFLLHARWICLYQELPWSYTNFCFWHCCTFLPERKNLSSSYLSRLFCKASARYLFYCKSFGRGPSCLALDPNWWRRGQMPQRELMWWVRTQCSNELSADMQSNNLQPLFIQWNLTEDTCWFPSPPWLTFTHPLTHGLLHLAGFKRISHLLSGFEPTFMHKSVSPLHEKLREQTV